MSKVFAVRNGVKYWEKESPEVGTFGRTVLKVFPNAGKIQVYPRVHGSPNGVGRGATIDLEHMSKEERVKILKMLNDTISNYKVEN